jgi:AAHS family 4-hydroxybenzoate transporter-like MFS transporter
MMPNLDSTTTTTEILFSSRKVTGFQIGIFIFCAVIALVDGFDFQSISVAAVPIAKELGLDPNSFGPIFAIGLLGGLVAGVVSGIVSDKVGRKPVLAICLALMALGSALTPLIPGFGPLLLWRVIVGFGLGGALPCIISLTSEYSPSRLRGPTVSLMFAGYPLGAFAAGLSANAIIPRLGWQGLFWVNAIVPLVLLIFLFALLPESVGFSALRGRVDRVAHVLSRMRIFDVAPASITPAPRPQRSTFVSVFQNGRAMGTIVLSLVLALDLLVTYFLASWLPVIGTDSGLPSSAANIAIALSSIGSIAGAIFIPRIRLKAGVWLVIVIADVLGAVAVAAIGVAAHTAPGLIVSALIAGMLTGGAQIATVGLTASFFDEAVRATGVGLAVGIGRLGAVVGPLLGGVLLQSHVAVPTIFLIIAGITVVSAIGMLILGLVSLRVRPIDTSVVTAHA